MMSKMSVSILALFAAAAVASGSDVSNSEGSCSGLGDDACASSHGDVLMQKLLLREKKVLTNPTPWTVDSAAFSDTMTATVAIDMGGQHYATSGWLFAFVGAECRGVSDETLTPPFGPYKGTTMFPITIYANRGGEAITFKFYAGPGNTIALTPGFQFAVNGNQGSAIAPLVLSAPPPAPVASWSWNSFDHTQFESSMSVVCFVVVDGQVPGDGALGAFSGGDMRGLMTSSQAPPFGPYKGIPMYFLMVYGNTAGDMISFKYKKADGTVVPLSYTVPFGSDRTIGDAMNPWMLHQ